MGSLHGCWTVHWHREPPQRSTLARARLGLRREAKLAAKLPVEAVVPISHAAFLPDAYLVTSVTCHPKAPSPLYRETLRCDSYSAFRSAGAVQNIVGRHGGAWLRQAVVCSIESPVHENCLAGHLAVLARAAMADGGGGSAHRQN